MGDPSTQHIFSKLPRRCRPCGGERKLTITIESRFMRTPLLPRWPNACSLLARRHADFTEAALFS